MGNHIILITLLLCVALFIVQVWRDQVRPRRKAKEHEINQHILRLQEAKLRRAGEKLEEARIKAAQARRRRTADSIASAMDFMHDHPARPAAIDDLHEAESSAPRGTDSEWIPS